jgi:hypothetical protein
MIAFYRTKCKIKDERRVVVVSPIKVVKHCIDGDCILPREWCFRAIIICVDITITLCKCDIELRSGLFNLDDPT